MVYIELVRLDLKIGIFTVRLTNTRGRTPKNKQTKIQICIQTPYILWTRLIKYGGEC